MRQALIKLALSTQSQGHGVPIRLIRTSAADVQGLVREFGKDIVLLPGRDMLSLHFAPIDPKLDVHAFGNGSDSIFKNCVSERKA